MRNPIELILPYLLLAAGLAANLVLFITVKRELRREQKIRSDAIEELAAKIQHLSEPREADSMEPLMSLPAPNSGFNLSRREQALRLLRRGEDVGHIAAAIGVTRAEVELLVRVQQISTAKIPTTI